METRRDRVRSSHRKCSAKKIVLKISENSQEKTCAGVSYSSPATLSKKETPAQVFSCKFWDIVKNTYFAEHLRTAASVELNKKKFKKPWY